MGAINLRGALLTEPTPSDLLVVKNLSKSFGSLAAVSDLSFEVRRGEILGIIGPNGAGKTTVFNLLTGVLKPDAGSVVLGDKDLTHLSAAKRCRAGIGRTYQIPRPFTKMTVLENLMVAAVHGGGLLEKKAKKKSDEILDLINLASVRNNFAGSLSLLDRKRLELGRALASQPALILIDEVAGGLTEKEVEQLLVIVQQIQKQGITIVWIEHIMMMMSEGADRVLCIAEGKHMKCGDPEEVMCSKEVLECYLGEEEA
jgi:branched-chain amino acid transport system ATP-binding protein